MLLVFCMWRRCGDHTTCDPFVFGPRFAMLSTPGLSCLKVKLFSFHSSLKAAPYILLPSENKIVFASLRWGGHEKKKFGLGCYST
jgi:hypothetical protein